MIIVDVGWVKQPPPGRHKRLDEMTDFVAFCNIHTALQECPDQEIVALGDLLASNQKNNPFNRLKEGEPIYIFTHGAPGYMANGFIPSVTLPNTAQGFTLENWSTTDISQTSAEGIGEILTRKLIEANKQGSRTTIHLACSSGFDDRARHIPSLIDGTTSSLAKQNIHGVKVEGFLGLGLYPTHYVAIEELEDLYYQPAAPNTALQKTIDTYLLQAKLSPLPSIEKLSSEVFSRCAQYYSDLVQSNISLCVIFPQNKGCIRCVSHAGFLYPSLDRDAPGFQTQLQVVYGLLKQYYTEQEHILEYKKTQGGLTTAEALTLTQIKEVLDGKIGDPLLHNTGRSKIFTVNIVPTITHQACMAEIQKLLPSAYQVELPYSEENQMVANMALNLQGNIEAARKYITSISSIIDTKKMTATLDISSISAIGCRQAEIDAYQNWLTFNVSDISTKRPSSSETYLEWARGQKKIIGKHYQDAIINFNQFVGELAKYLGTLELSKQKQQLSELAKQNVLPLNILVNLASSLECGKEKGYVEQLVGEHPILKSMAISLPKTLSEPWGKFTLTPKHTDNWLDDTTVRDTITTNLRRIGVADDYVVAPALDATQNAGLLSQVLHDRYLGDYAQGNLRPFTVVPINFGNNHWATMVIEQNDDRRSAPNVYFFDSMGSTPARMQLLTQMLRNTGIYTNPNITDLSKNVQADSYSCGTWTIEMASRIVQERRAGHQPPVIDTHAISLNITQLHVLNLHLQNVRQMHQHPMFSGLSHPHKIAILQLESSMKLTSDFSAIQQQLSPIQQELQRLDGLRQKVQVREESTAKRILVEQKTDTIHDENAGLPLHALVRSLIALSKEDFARELQLPKYTKEDFEQKNADGLTPIEYAAAIGRPDNIIAKLEERDKELNAQKLRY